MRDTTLMQQALGLPSPRTEVRSDFDTEASRLDEQIDFIPGSRFACPGCGAADCPAYDTQRKTWRHLNFFQHQTYLNARLASVSKSLRTTVQGDGRPSACCISVVSRMVGPPCLARADVAWRRARRRQGRCAPLCDGLKAILDGVCARRLGRCQAGTRKQPLSTEPGNTTRWIAKAS